MALNLDPHCAGFPRFARHLSDISIRRFTGDVHQGWVQKFKSVGLRNAHRLTSKLSTMIGRELPIAATGYRQKSTQNGPLIGCESRRSFELLRFIIHEASRIASGLDTLGPVY